MYHEMRTMNTQPQSGNEGEKIAAHFDVVPGPEQVVASLSGTWTGPFVHLVDAGMRELEMENRSVPLVIDLSAVDQLDTAGAWIIRRLQMSAGATGRAISLKTDNYRHLELLNAIKVSQQQPQTDTRANPLIRLLEALGKHAYGFRDDFIMGSHIIGASIRGAQLKAGKRGSIRIKSIIHQMEIMGLQAVPIIALMSFLIGIIIAQQGAMQLKVFGAELLVVDLVGILHLREIGVLLTAIMVAGRSGSAITAELGSMKMREEVDALTVIGLNPVGVLIFPRIVALVIVLPLLTIVSDIFGMIGAIVISWAYVDIPPQLFINTLRIAVDLSTVFSGLIKAPFMALIIGLVAAIEGMKVSGSAESLGKHTTASVVKSIFVVIVVDGLFAIFYGAIDY